MPGCGKGGNIKKTIAISKFLYLDFSVCVCVCNKMKVPKATLVAHCNYNNKKISRRIKNAP